jgi:ligand-binding sensor domain-containing protein
MKTYYKALLFFVLVLLKAQTIYPQWVQTNGPYGKQVYSLAVSGTNLFAGTFGDGVFLSTNNGTSWAAVNTGLTNSYVYVLAVSGTNLFAGAYQRVFLSTNNGTSWTGNYLAATWFQRLAVLGTNLFAGTSGLGVYLSTNNGTSWTPINSGLTNKLIQSFVVSGTNLFAGTQGGVFLTTNNGTSWTLVNSGLPNSFITALAVSGTNLFAGTRGDGVFLSTNNGTSWTAVNIGLTNINVNEFAVSGMNLFAGTDGGVFLSTNNGTSWTAVNTGLTNSYVYAFAVSGTNLFAGTDSCVWRRPLSEMITSVERLSTELPTHFSLDQNFPNPFNPGTVISYSLPTASNVKITIYNTIGQTVQTLENGFKNAGNYSVNFNTVILPSGIYIYRIEAGQFSQIKKMILLK